MKRYQIVILPAILLLLAGCARSAVLSSPSVQVPEENETWLLLNPHMEPVFMTDS